MCFAAVRHPFDGPAQQARRPGCQGVFRVKRTFHAETAADIVDDDPELGGDLLSRIPMGRFGQIADVVGAVVFLASPAAALISGTTLMVDGGWSAQ